MSFLQEGNVRISLEFLTEAIMINATRSSYFALQLTYIYLHCDSCQLKTATRKCDDTFDTRLCLRVTLHEVFVNSAHSNTASGQMHISITIIFVAFNIHN